MLCQIKLPTRNITIGVDLSKIDVVEIGHSPDLDDPVTIFILMYKADEVKPAIQINCSKLKVDEVMDLFDHIMDVKAGKDVPSCYTMAMLKAK